MILQINHHAIKKTRLGLMCWFFAQLETCFLKLGWVLKKSRWWFQILFIFTPNLGEDEPNLTYIFQMGWLNHQPEMGVRCGFPRFVCINSKKPWNSSYDPSSQVPKERSLVSKESGITWM